MPRGIYDRKKKKKEKPKEVDPVNLQFPKPENGKSFMILRNRARNINHALKEKK